MRLSLSVIRVTVLTVVALTISTAAATASSDTATFNFGGNAFFSTKPVPLKRLPTLEMISSVPQFIDPFELDVVPMVCFVVVEKKGTPVNKVRGRFTSELYVHDHNTGRFETFKIDSRKFKTTSNRFITIEFEIPTSIFADGFESGDVSAWFYTRVNFTNKKADTAQVTCQNAVLK